MFKVIIAVIIGCAVVLVGFMVIDPKVDMGLTPGTVDTTNTTSFRVTVEGEVIAPATYVLKDNALMSDLIEAAGGLTSNADSLAYYESAALESGKTYYIASKFDSSDICYTTELTKANINTGTADDLVLINGISSSIASSIVSYRVDNGQFNTIEDLLNVYGIGNATYRKIRNYVTLHE